MKRPNRISKIYLLILPLFFLFTLSVFFTALPYVFAVSPSVVASCSNQANSGTSLSCNITIQSASDALIIWAGYSSSVLSTTCSAGSACFTPALNSYGGTLAVSVLEESGTFASSTLTLGAESAIWCISSPTVGSQTPSISATGSTGNSFSMSVYEVSGVSCSYYQQNTNSLLTSGTSVSVGVALGSSVGTPNIAVNAAGYALNLQQACSSNPPPSGFTAQTGTSNSGVYYDINGGNYDSITDVCDFSTSGSAAASGSSAVFYSQAQQITTATSSTTETQTDTAFNTPSPSSTVFWLIPFLFLMMPTLVFIGLGLLGRVNGSGLLFLALIGLNAGAIFGILAQIMPFGVLILTGGAFLIVLWKGR